MSFFGFFKAKTPSPAEVEAECASAFADLVDQGYMSSSRDDLLYAVWLGRLPDSVFSAMSQEESEVTWDKLSRGGVQ